MSDSLAFHSIIESGQPQEPDEAISPANIEKLEARDDLIEEVSECQNISDTYLEKLVTNLKVFKSYTKT